MFEGRYAIVCGWGLQFTPKNKGTGGGRWALPMSIESREVQCSEGGSEVCLQARSSACPVICKW